MLTRIIAVIAAIMSVFNLALNNLGYARIPFGRLDMSKFNAEPVFVEEFDADSLEGTAWSPAFGQEYGRAIVQRGGYWDPDMISVHDGALHLTTKYFADGHNNGGPGWYGSAVYTQGMAEFTHGYFECRAKLSPGYGLWSAFWMMPNEGLTADTGRKGAEIDIMEAPNYGQEKKRNSVMHAIHYGNHSDKHEAVSFHDWRVNGDAYNEYHVYGCEWNENGYTFYIDGKKTVETDFGGASMVPEYLILSTEIRGENAVPVERTEYGGKNIEENGGFDFVTEFIVDYVKVYSYK